MKQITKIAFIDQQSSSRFLKGLSLVSERNTSCGWLFSLMEIHFFETNETKSRFPMMTVEFQGHAMRMGYVLGMLDYREQINEGDCAYIAKGLNAFVGQIYDDGREVYGPDGEKLLEEKEPTISFLDVINEHLEKYELKRVLNQGIA